MNASNANEAMMDILKGIEIPHGFSSGDIHTMLDTKGAGVLSTSEFIDGLFRLLYANPFQHNCLIQHSVAQIGKQVRSEIDSLLEELYILVMGTDEEWFSDSSCVNSEAIDKRYHVGSGKSDSAREMPSGRGAGKGDSVRDMSTEGRRPLNGTTISPRRRRAASLESGAGSPKGAMRAMRYDGVSQLQAIREEISQLSSMQVEILRSPMFGSPGADGSMPIPSWKFDASAESDRPCGESANIASEALLPRPHASLLMPCPMCKGRPAGKELLLPIPTRASSAERAGTGAGREGVPDAGISETSQITPVACDVIPAKSSPWDNLSLDI
jgi:hypothetical protein